MLGSTQRRSVLTRRAGVVAVVTVVALLAGVVPALAFGPVRVVRPSAWPVFRAPGATTQIDSDAPDPHIVRFGSTYYVYTTGTTWGNHIGILRSSRPDRGFQPISGSRWGSSAFPSIPYTRPVQSWQVVGTLHSPAVFYRGERFVMYYTAQARYGHGGRYCLSVAVARKPEGPFVGVSSRPFLCLDSEGGVIDPVPFVDRYNRVWLYFKTYDDANTSTQPSGIWVVRLSSDGRRLAGTPTQVLSQRNLSSPYETVENPQMLYVRGRYMLLYSRGDWFSANYRQGYALCSRPQGPCRESPQGDILTTYTGARGPGGGTIVKDRGGGLWLAYHGWQGAGGCTNYTGTSCARRLFTARVSIPIP